MAPTIDEIIRKHTKHDKWSVKEQQELTQQIFDWITAPPVYKLVIGNGPSVVRVPYD